MIKDIIKKIYEILNIFQNARKIINAWHLLSLDKIEDSEIEINSVNEEIIQSNFEYMIIKGYIKSKNYKIDESIFYYKKAWIKASKKLNNENDRYYVLKYIYDLFKVDEMQIKNDKLFINIDNNPIYKINYEDFNLEKVNKKLKSRFPQRDHPDWKI